MSLLLSGANDAIPYAGDTTERAARCPSPNINQRVDVAGQVYRWNGTTWMPQPGSPADTAVVPISSYSGDVGAAIASAIAALPTNGGVVDARSATGAQSMAADLTISGKRVTIWFGRMLLTMGTNRIIVANTANYTSLVGATTFGGYDGVTNQTYFDYSGTVAPITVGDSSTQLQGFSIEDMGIYVGAAGTASAGLLLQNLVYFRASRLRIEAKTVPGGTEAGIKCDGTGGFVGHGRIEDCRIANGKYGLWLTGSGVAACNALTIENNGIAGGSTGTGLLVEANSNGNLFAANDLENWGTGLSITGNGANVGIGLRFEGNTTDISLGASSVNNWLSTAISTVVLSDSGTGNFVQSGTTTVGRIGARIGVGIDPASDRIKNTSSVGASLTGTNQFGEVLQMTGTSAATASVIGHHVAAGSAAAAITTAEVIAHQSRAATAGALSTITKAIGHVMEPQTAGTANAFNEKRGPNGGYWESGQATESLTLSTGGATTDTSANLLPADAVIEAVCTRVTTTITTAATFSVGDATTAARFTSASAGITSGSTTVGLLHQAGNVTTTAAGPTQAAAAKVRITCNTTPGAGVVRITVYYRRFVAPTS